LVLVRSGPTAGESAPLGRTGAEASNLPTPHSPSVRRPAVPRMIQGTNREWHFARSVAGKVEFMMRLCSDLVTSVALESVGSGWLAVPYGGPPIP
jgi:hypothetical protein